MCFLGLYLLCVCVCVCIYLCGCILTSGGTVEFDLREDWRQTFIILIKIILTCSPMSTSAIAVRGEFIISF